MRNSIAAPTKADVATSVESHMSSGSLTPHALKCRKCQDMGIDNRASKVVRLGHPLKRIRGSIPRLSQTMVKNAFILLALPSPLLQKQPS